MITMFLSSFFGDTFLKYFIKYIDLLFLHVMIALTCYISLRFCLSFISSCDFRIPQEWENPSWIFDLTIPLVNEEYLMSTIASESNNIEITADSLDFIIELKEEIITEGDVVTDESFFIIPASQIDLSLDQIIVSNPNPMPEIPAFGETIYIKLFAVIILDLFKPLIAGN